MDYLVRSERSKEKFLFESSFTFITNTLFVHTNSFLTYLKIKQTIDFDLIIDKLNTIYNKKINKIVFDHLFDISIDSLPDSIESIHFYPGSCFSQPINKLPRKLTELKLDTCNFFNSTINFENCFELNTLTLPENFNKYLNLSETNLEYLILPQKYNTTLDTNSLSKSIKHLLLESSIFNSDLLINTSFLTDLNIVCTDFNQTLDNLPVTLKQLSLFSDRFNQPLDNLPNSIITMILHLENFTFTLDKLPEGLINLHVSLGNKNIQYLNNLPTTLEKLVVNYKEKNHGMLEYLPCGLKFLEITGEFNELLLNLPDSINYLDLPYCYNKPIYWLPNSLNCLSMSCNNILVDNLPKNLLLIDITEDYNEKNSFIKITKNPSKVLTINYQNNFQLKILPNGKIIKLFNKKLIF